MAGSKKAVRAALRDEKRKRLAEEDGTVVEQSIEAEDNEEEEEVEADAKIETGMDQFQANAGSALFFPAQASSVRKGGFILINGFPCKVVHMSTAKTGKHGGAKIHFTAVDIFTSKKMEALHMSTANVEVPNVTRTEYTLIDVSDDFLSLMDADGNTRQDIRTPDNLKNELKAKFEAGSNMFIIVMMAMGQEVAQEYREVTAGKTA